MNNEAKQAFILLENLKIQLKREPYGELNRFIKFDELYQIIDDTLTDLQQKSYEGITLSIRSIRVGKTMTYISDALAFEGLRFSKKQAEAWEAFSRPSDQKLQNNATAIKLIQHLGSW